MLNNKKVIVVLPAYNAEKTLEQTYREIPLDVVDSVLLVDDGSADQTINVAKALGIETISHHRNYGYGRNQKTCYGEALKRNADIVIMVHPDYQYTPKLIVAMTSMIAFGIYDVVLGSRIVGGGALKGGMPFYKYFANRFLTAVQNIMLGSKLSEFHTGYRAYSREVLENLPIQYNSDDFVFDNEILAQCIYLKYRVGEVSCPTSYFEDASSIDFRSSIGYGIGVLATSIKFTVQRWGLANFPIFKKELNTEAMGDDFRELK
ncbi:glycosyltransferase family 2 protein [Thermodesulfobacteriota bacterium]